MRTRALIHVDGPPQSGKTAFVEAMLGSIDAWILTARCVRHDSLRQPRESAPKNHPELRRYRQAGAMGAALFRFPGEGRGFDDFFSSDLMTDYSEAVFLEGDDLLGYFDLKVFVAPPPVEGERLFVRRRSAVDEAAVLQRLIADTDGMIELLSLAGGEPFAELGRQNPTLLESVRQELVASVRDAGLVAALKQKKPKQEEHWAIADRYAGIQHAGLVVINLRAGEDRAAAEELAAEVKRLREDAELFSDVLGHRGSRVPITVVVANLVHPADTGTRKASTRVRRAIRSAVS